MDQHREELNRFLVEVFHQVLKTEELALSRAKGELSLRELHLIEEVCRAADLGLDNRATAIAAAQRVTAGTLTTAVSLLERKGYLERRRDEHDKRVVRILPTEKARQANREHERFHEEMVDYICYPYLDYTFEVYGYLSKTQVTDTLRQKNRRTYPLVSLSQKCDRSARCRDLK